MNDYLIVVIAFLMSAVLVPLLVDEVADWFPWAAHRLILRAARRLPDSASERYGEEWLAELDALPGGKLNKLRFGLSILLGSFSLKRELNHLPLEDLPLPSVSLREMAPADFEYFVGELMEAMGYKSRITTPANDGGVDIVAERRRPIRRELTVVQVKRCRDRVPVEQVRAFLWVAKEHKAKAVFVTSSIFGKATLALARTNNHLRLIDGVELKQLAAQHLKVELQLDFTRASSQS